MKVEVAVMSTPTLPPDGNSPYGVRGRSHGIAFGAKMLVNGSFSVATDFTKNSCSGFSQKKPGNLKQEHHEREEGCRKARLGVGGRVPESEAWSGRKSTGNRGLD